MYLVIDLYLSHAVTINIPCVAASRTNYQHTQSSTRGIHLKDNSGIDAFDAKIWFQDSVVNDIVTTPVLGSWKLCTLLWTITEERLRYKKWLHILSNLHKYIQIWHWPWFWKRVFELVLWLYNATSNQYFS